MTPSSRILKALKDIPAARSYVIALSGGMDSVLLLHAFRSLHPSVPLRAIHVHHGLSCHADHWASFCQSTCASLSVDCWIEKVTVSPAGEGVEAAARKARYAVFNKYLNTGDLLLQGHHQNDQAETVLIRAFRGSGPKGLSGIPVERALSGGGRLYRPWLSLTRGELEEEARMHSLSWVEDESNMNEAFDRNFLRHQVIPVIERRWPAVVRSLAQVADRSAETQAFMDTWCDKQFKSGLLRKGGRYRLLLSLESLLAYSEFEQSLLLRAWIEGLGFQQPSARIFERIHKEVISARDDASPMVEWAGCIMRRYDGHLYCFPKRPQPKEAYSFSVGLGGGVGLGKPGQGEVFGSNGMHFSVKLVENMMGQAESEVYLSVPECEVDLSIRSRTGGELLGGQSSGKRVSLKDFFKKQKVPPWERDNCPLIYLGKELVAVGQYWVHPEFAAKSGNTVLSIRISS